MSKYIVHICPEYNNYYDWEDNVCEDFYENVVIDLGRYNDEYEKASWWQDTEYIIRDIDNCNDQQDFVSYFRDEYAKDKLEDVYKAYYDWDGNDKAEFYAKVAMIIFPGLDLVVDRINGCGRGDSADVVYVKDSLDINELEDWFYGDVYDIRLYEVSDEQYEEFLADGYDEDDIVELINYGDDIDGALLSYTELQRIQRDHGTKEQGFIEYFGLPEDTDITIYDEA